MFNILFALSLLAASALAAPECPPPDSTFYLIPHENNCAKFYSCSNGVPVQQTCPDGTHFNPDFMECQNPVSAGCGSSPPESELTCSWPDFLVLHPHPHSCSKYYVCVFGKAHVFSCPKGLEFNAKRRKCVWPHESNCKISHGGCKSGTLSRHEDCSKFYICDHGVKVAMDCPRGLQWSSKFKRCEWPYRSDCGIQDFESDVAQNGDAQNGDEEDGAEQGDIIYGATELS